MDDFNLVKMPTSVGVRRDGETPRRSAVSVVECHGELDLAFRPVLVAALDVALDAHDHRIVVDMSGVAFFDCSAIGAFVAARLAANSSGRAFHLLGLSAHGLRVLGSAGLTDLAGVSLDGGSRADLTETGGFAAHAEVVYEQWVAACTMHPTLSAPLVIDNARAVIDRMAAQLDGTEPSGAGSVERALGAMDGTASAMLVVAQLLVLRSVAQGWPVHSSPAQARERSQRIDAAVDGAVVAVMADSVTYLEEAAYVDALTGLWNRRAADRDLDQAVARADRPGRSLSVVMVDVNDLKGINDRLGHPAGDRALRDVAAELTAVLRAGDNVYRVGGDEFLLVLPNMDAADVAHFIERADVAPHTTFSWGSAGLPRDQGTASELVALADRRLIEHRAPAPVPAADRPASSDAVPSLAGDLRFGGRNRILVEQATGLVAHHFDVPVAIAFRILDDYARSQLVSAADVAVRVMAHKIDLRDLRPPSTSDLAVASEAGHHER